MATADQIGRARDPEAMARLKGAVPVVRLRCVTNGHVVPYDGNRGAPTAHVLAKLRCPVCKTRGMTRAA